MLLSLRSLFEAEDAPIAGPPTVIPSPLDVVSTIGTAADFLDRLKKLLPTRWWNVTAPRRDAVLGGISDALAWAYSLNVFVKAQERLSTATGQFIDLFAYDYLGLTIRRRVGEVDAAFAARVKKELLRPRVTRAAMYEALDDLTGRPPTIIEPWNTGDCGAWDVGTWAWAGEAVGAVNGGGFQDGNLAYDTTGCFYIVPTGVINASGGAGCWGDLLLPQVLIIVAPPIVQGVPNISGWDDPQSAWNIGSTYYVDPADITGPLTIDDVYAVINQTKPVGVSVWVQFALGWPSG